MSCIRPEEYLSKVEIIDAHKLLAQGKTTVLLDVDNTLVPRDVDQVPASVIEWVETLKASGLRICLLSNNWHQTVLTYAQTLGLPIVRKAIKPLPFAFLHAIRKVGGTRRSAVVIGDQLVTDVFGAHFLRMYAILVAPQAARDLWHTLLLRRIEHLFMRGMSPTR
ncbi:MAG: YqeG family HAD IIIA-type phosphatase [Coriobacteriia bacterium]|nr:YqeG family HAD IIIA-type phosphatase [Coriobacteriia bacterium]